jgi:Ig-like domain-containing protein
LGEEAKMRDAPTRLIVMAVLSAALLLAIILGVGQTRLSSPSPTVDVGQVKTAAVATFAGGLTATAHNQPSPTLTPTAAPTGTGPTPLEGSHTPTCLALRFLRDVTIPDNTQMTPAQVFTKSWLVENTGTCPWRPGFQVILVGGIAMGGSPFKVAQAVGPGGDIQISIKMAAPTNQLGVVQGTWKMADDRGAVFGDYLSVVVVVNGGTGAPSASVGTSTPTPSATP